MINNSPQPFQLTQVILEILRLFQQSVEREWLKRPTSKLSKLGERLDPGETERVQHGTGTLHTNKDGNAYIHR